MTQIALPIGSTAHRTVRVVLACTAYGERMGLAPGLSRHESSIDDRRGISDPVSRAQQFDWTG